MKTLYLSDLDGTLLRRDDRLSLYTVNVLNALLSGGTLFSYATARSLASASRVTEGLHVSLPAIVYNGAFIMDAHTGERLISHLFNDAFRREASDFLSPLGVFPLVYAFVDGEERVSWLTGRENRGIRHYVHTRAGDKRLRPVSGEAELYAGDVFYITCIGERGALGPVYEHYGGNRVCNCTLQQELYREEWWCEIMPKQATKGNAALLLKEMLGCDKLVVFGDAINDLPLFAAADASYAVENAAEAVKHAATGVVPSNENDGVARWLEQNVRGNGSKNER